MFHTSHIRVPQHRRPTTLRTFVTSSFSSPHDKAPSPRGPLFIVVAGVLLLVGSFLTWFGFNDVFGGKIVIGPLLIILALILMLICTRQFFLARKHNRNRLQLGPIGQGTLRAVVVDHNDGLGAVTVIMDPLDVDSSQSNRCSGMENYAPPTYSEIAEGTSSTYRPYSPQNQDEPPPPYIDAILSNGNNFTLHLPKYEAIGGRRSPVPKYEDIFLTSNLPGYIPSCHSPVCLSHNHISSSPHQISCHVCVSCSPSQPVCVNSSSPNTTPHMTHSCSMSHTCCSVNPNQMPSHQGLQSSTCHLHSNASQGQGQDQSESHYSNASQCHIQQSPCCVNHCCSCTHTPPSCSPCSPHQTVHRTCVSNHFTFPCTHNICSCSNHTSNVTNQNEDTNLINQDQIQDQTENTSTPITISVTDISSTPQQGCAVNNLIDNSEEIVGNDDNIDQSRVDDAVSTNPPIRIYCTPTQDTEHTF
ncbi:hypothetical protein SNE40_010126 [Patella caerulea]|uniref:Uncharacterized protein n=1 Tax=Patella caerulea TaxID=87958 RepID=A0AAN8Q468_PATCE